MRIFATITNAMCHARRFLLMTGGVPRIKGVSHRADDLRPAGVEASLAAARLLNNQDFATHYA
jgi:hypothetical protein